MSIYSYAAVDGQTEMRFFKPGIVGPWLTNTLSVAYNPDLEGFEEIVSKQIFGDGQIYRYSYNEVPASGKMNSQLNGIAGGLYIDKLNNVTEVKFGIIPKPVVLMPTDPLPCNEVPMGSVMRTVTITTSGFSPQEIDIFVAMPLYTMPVGPGCLISIGRPSFGNSPYYPEPELGDIIYQVTPGPSEVIDPLGRIWKNDYCDRRAFAGFSASQRDRCLVSTLQSSEGPDGRKTEFDIPWSTRNVQKTTQKATTGSGLADIVTSATFNCLKPVICSRPTSRTDAKGKVTSYTYDENHGGLLKELSPTVNGVSLEKRYQYVARKAWTKARDGNGYEQSLNNHTLLAREVYCLTSATVNDNCAAGPSDQVLTIYDYGPDSGPNNLYLRGMSVTSGGVTLRTCYGYDSFGRRVSETKPLANLSVCP